MTLSRSSRKWPNENVCFSSRIHCGHSLSYMFSVHLNQICKEFGLHLFQVHDHRATMQASRSPRMSTKPISQVWLRTAHLEIQGRGGGVAGAPWKCWFLGPASDQLDQMLWEWRPGIGTRGESLVYCNVGAVRCGHCLQSPPLPSPHKGLGVKDGSLRMSASCQDVNSAWRASGFISCFYTEGSCGLQGLSNLLKFSWLLCGRVGTRTSVPSFLPQTLCLQPFKRKIS